MPDVTDAISWPGPMAITSHTVQPLNAGGLAEVPNASDVSAWLGQAQENYGDDGPFQGAEIDLWSTERADNPLQPHQVGDKLYYGLTLGNKSEIGCTLYAAGTDNVPLDDLCIHERLGHGSWWWMGFGSHTTGTDAVLAVFANLTGCGSATAAVQAEVWAEACKVLFGLPNQPYGYAGTYLHPDSVPGIKWFLQRARTVTQWMLTHTPDPKSLTYSTMGAGCGYWEWTESGTWHYTDGDGIVYRWTGSAWSVTTG